MNSAFKQAPTGFSTRSAEVYTALRDDIVSGKLPMGTRLVRRDVAKRLNVSPIPVIEALHRLEKDGLTESSPMYGSRVITWDIESLRSDEMLREAIECQCARLFAELSTKRDLDELRELAVLLDNSTMKEGEGLRPPPKYHHAFHYAIARVSGCKSLIDEFNRVWLRRQMRFAINTSQDDIIPPDWHQRLVDALASRSPAMADEAMRAHVQFGRDKDPIFIKKLQDADISLTSCWTED